MIGRLLESCNRKWNSEALAWSKVTRFFPKKKKMIMIAHSSVKGESSRLKGQDKTWIVLFLHNYIPSGGTLRPSLDILIFLSILDWRYSWIILLINYSLWHFRFRMYWGFQYNTIQFNTILHFKTFTCDKLTKECKLARGKQKKTMELVRNSQ